MLTTATSQFSATPSLPLPASKIVTPHMTSPGKFRTLIPWYKKQEKTLHTLGFPGNIFGNELADKAAKLFHSSSNALTLSYFSYNNIKKVIEDDNI